ncbi:hypothetical protein C8Q73DRAFT_526096 [Cubamyces lactineus]|nr:hypothetical protein C8Q73DRAFT_526096 [Cubamyces lactineus]
MAHSYKKMGPTGRSISSSERPSRSPIQQRTSSLRAGERPNRPKPRTTAETTKGHCPRSHNRSSHLQLPSLLSTLNQDVLLHMSTFLSIDDISCMSRTSRRMYELLAREMLKRPVELWPQDIHSYLRFLRHIRREKQLPTKWEININIEYSAQHKCEKHERCANAGCRFRNKHIRGDWLIKLLSSARGLTGLTLAGVFDVALDVQGFRDVFSSLPHLRRLTLGRHWCNSLHGHLASLQGLLPKLRVLELKYKPESLHLIHHGRASWEISLGPQLALLEVLEIHTLLLAHDDIQLPQLRRLVIDRLVVGASASSCGGILSRSFPNLEYLAVQQIIAQIPPEEYISPDGAMHSSPSIPSDASWSGHIPSVARPDLHSMPLRYLRVGSLLDLVQLDVPCVEPLARIDIGPLQPGAHPRTVELAFELMRPRCITFYTTPGEVTEVRDLLEALLGRVDRMAYITHMAYNTSTWALLKFNVETLAVELGRVLKESSVTHFFVRIFELPGRDIFARRLDGVTLDALVARAYDHTVKAQQVLASNVPTLRSVFFEVGDYGLRGWIRDEASSRRSGRQWRELDTPETEQMLRKEDLHCSHLNCTLDSSFGGSLSWTVDG